MPRTDGTLDFTAGSRAMQDRAMTEALEADGEKLRAMTGEDHGPWPLMDAEEEQNMRDLGLVDAGWPTPEQIDQLQDMAAADGCPADIYATVAEQISRAAPAPTRRMTNATWRILEEQRVSAIEIVAECEAEIAKWTTKRDDAMRAADMCLAGQNGGE